MRVLCAPTQFKESLTAVEAAAAMARGTRAAASSPRSMRADCCPIADGGDGTLDALADACGGRILTAMVQGPLAAARDPRPAAFALLDGGRAAIVELARASGLALLPQPDRSPLRTTTYGTGELILAAVQAGAREIILGIGGSATVDGGAGIVQALGGRFFDDAGRLLDAPLTGGDLLRIARIERPPALPRIRVACDVRNPLCGPDGAAAVYGPQKGATLEQVRHLDSGLAHLASLLEADPAIPGAGAAGGCGFGLHAICAATLESGVDLVLEAVRFDERCRDADLVLTGEGRLDGQSMQGKAVIGAAHAAARLGVPTIAIVGCTGPGAEQCVQRVDGGGGPLLRVVSLSDRFGLDKARAQPALLIERAAAEVVAEVSEADSRD